VSDADKIAELERERDAAKAELESRKHGHQRRRVCFICGVPCESCDKLAEVERELDELRAKLAEVKAEVDEMENQAEVDEAHGGDANQNAAIALRSAIKFLRAALDYASSPEPTK
jgi:hypothetical protein